MSGVVCGGDVWGGCCVWCVFVGVVDVCEWCCGVVCGVGWEFVVVGGDVDGVCVCGWCVMVCCECWCVCDVWDCVGRM